MEFKLKASSDLEIKNEIIQSLNSLNQNELMSLKNYLQNRNVIHIIEEKSNQKSFKLKRKSQQKKKIETLKNKKRKKKKNVKAKTHIIKKKINKNKKIKKCLVKNVKTISIKKKKKIKKKQKKNNQMIQLGLLKKKNIKNDIPIILLN